MSNLKQETEKPTINNNSGSDQLFQVLEDVTNIKISKNSTNMGQTYPCRISDKSQHKQEILSESSVRQKSIHLSDELLQTSNICSTCTKCAQLEKNLQKALADKQVAQYSLMQTTILFDQLKKQYKIQKQETVNKTQLNYCVQSLKQMLKSYQDENERIQKFLFQVISYTPKVSGKKKSTCQIVEGVVTDIISSWQEILKQLNYLTVISSAGNYTRVSKQNVIKFDHFAALAKLEQIKQNILELQRRYRAK